MAYPVLVDRRPGRHDRTRKSQGVPPDRQSATVRCVVQVENQSGLHMRECSAIVSAAGRFRAKVTVQKDDRVEDAESILGLMTLGAAQGDRLMLAATGPEAGEALDALAELPSVARVRFGERV